ncbi:MAG: IS200/IS605 family transposase [Desulfobulbales bacterium]
METQESLKHTVWDCKYHVVWIPKYRRKVVYRDLRRELGEVFRELAKQKESAVEEGHLQADHLHMLLSIPPKYSVAQVVGFMKGKSAIHIARTFMNRRKNFMGENFWARGYYVSTAGKDEEIVRRYIIQQEAADRRVDQLQLFR